MQEIQVINIFYGLLGVFLFRFRNHNKYLKNIISLLIFLVFVTELLFFYFSERVGLIGWGISGGGLVIAYFIRKYRNGFRTGVDYIKCIAIVAIATFPSLTYPAYLYNYFPFTQGKFILLTTGYFILPISLLIYLYDRYILKPLKEMKRKFIVTLAVQGILLVIAFVYAFIQQTKAIAAQKQAEQNLVLATEYSKRADEALQRKKQLELKLDSIQKGISK